jgi:hypothetical protein
VVVPFPSHAGPIGGLSVVVAMGTSLAAFLALARALRVRPLALELPLAARVAFVTALAAAPLAAFEHLPSAWFTAGPDHVRFLGLALPKAFATLAHTSERTWLVMLEVSGTVAAAVALSSWVTCARTLATRAIDVAGAVLVFALVVLVLGRAGGALGIAELLLFSAALAGGLALLALSASPRASVRVGACLLVPVLALGLSAWRWSATLEALAGASRGVAMRERQERIDSAPKDVRHRFDYRLAVVGDPGKTVLHTNDALLYDVAGTTSYDARRVPKDLLVFFSHVGAADASRLPYEMRVDWGRLDERGLLPLFGVRWFLTTDKSAFVPRGADEIAPGLFEDTRAFPKAWALRSWEVEPDLGRTVTRLAALAKEDALGTRGVLAEGAPVAPSGEGHVLVRDVQPGRIVLASRSAADFVVATNELFQRGWALRVDGQTAVGRILRVNGIFVGTSVPAGEHEVELRARID